MLCSRLSHRNAVLIMKKFCRDNPSERLGYQKVLETSWRKNISDDPLKLLCHSFSILSLCEIILNLLLLVCSKLPVQSELKQNQLYTFSVLYGFVKKSFLNLYTFIDLLVDYHIFQTLYLTSSKDELINISFHFRTESLTSKSINGSRY